MSEPVQTPQDLVDAFKRSGEFDRLRRELLAEFRKSDGISNFRTRVEDIAQSHLRRQKERKRPADADTDALQRNLMAEMDRFPIVDRAITEMRVFRDDSAVKMNVNNSLKRVLLKSRGEPIPPELEDLQLDGDLSPRKARSPSRADEDRGGETPYSRRDESEVRDRPRTEPPVETTEHREPSPVTEDRQAAQDEHPAMNEDLPKAATTEIIEKPDAPESAPIVGSLASDTPSPVADEHTADPTENTDHSPPVHTSSKPSPPPDSMSVTTS